MLSAKEIEILQKSHKFNKLNLWIGLVLIVLSLTLATTSFFMPNKVLNFVYKELYEIANQEKMVLLSYVVTTDLEKTLVKSNLDMVDAMITIVKIVLDMILYLMALTLCVFGMSAVESYIRYKRNFNIIKKLWSNE